MAADEDIIIRPAAIADAEQFPAIENSAGMLFEQFKMAEQACKKYLAAGFDEYFPKPILDIEHFVTTVRRLLSQREPRR